MVKIKETSSSYALKTAKNKFNKNRSFSGVEIKKSPKSRRKSLATVLSTPKKHKLKQETILNEWIVKEGNAEETVTLSPPRSSKKKKVEVTKLTGSGQNRKASKNEKITIDKSQNVSFIETVNENKPEVRVNANIENLEQQFDIKFANVKDAVEGAIKFRANNPKLQNQLFQDRVPLFLQICCHKIPRGNPKILRIPLPNSVITADDEICLIVPEVKGIKNIEHEKHVEHYEELLRKKAVQNIKKIMTFHEFRTEYETFEQKSRLVDLYDVFLVDGRISGKVVNKCGNIFYKKRKVPTAVKLQVSKLKEHVDKALSKVYCHLHLKGDSFNVQFGHDKMEIDDLVQNVFSIIDTLNKEFPGGFNNVKGLHVRIERAPSIPIYMSFKNPNDVKVLKFNSKKPKAYKSYKDELTTLPNAQVTVKPSGQVLVTRVKHDKDGDSVADDENKEKQKKNKRKQTDAAEVAKKKRKIEVNLKVRKQHVANTPENGHTSDSKGAKKKNKKNVVSISRKVEVPDGEVLKKKKKSDVVSILKSAQASDNKVLKKKKKMNVGNVPKEAESSHSKVIKKKKTTVVSVPKKIKNYGSGENLKKKSKTVNIVGKNEEKSINKKKKKNKFTI